MLPPRGHCWGHAGSAALLAVLRTSNGGLCTSESGGVGASHLWTWCSEQLPNTVNVSHAKHEWVCSCLELPSSGSFQGVFRVRGTKEHAALILGGILSVRSHYLLLVWMCDWGWSCLTLWMLLSQPRLSVVLVLRAPGPPTFTLIYASYIIADGSLFSYRDHLDPREKRYVPASISSSPQSFH